MSFPDNQWHIAPQGLFLADKEVHVWCASLDSLATPKAWQLLSEDEEARAQRFRLELHRQRFVVGRSILRVLLGRYLHTAPESIAFSYAPNGKPFLVPQNSVQSVEFNVSHSQEMALYAFVRRQAIGVDIEYVRAFPDMHTIVNRFFSLQEQKLFHSLPASRQTAAFFAAWTRKEAYLKACGEGLSLPLSQFEVSLEPDETAQVLAIDGNRDEAAQWFLQDILPPISGYRAAVVLRGNRPNRVSYWLYE